MALCNRLKVILSYTCTCIYRNYQHHFDNDDDDAFEIGFIPFLLLFWANVQWSDARFPEHTETDCIAYANVSEFKIFQVMMFSLTQFCPVHGCRYNEKIESDRVRSQIGRSPNAIERDEKRMVGAIDRHSTVWLAVQKGLMVFWNGSIFRYFAHQYLHLHLWKYLRHPFAHIFAIFPAKT